MLKTWTDAAWDDYCRWQRIDRKIFKRINQLIDDIDRNGYDGIGKPEPLKHELTGYWSRHTTNEHRLVYRISGDQIVIVSCRTHYKREPVEAPSYIPTEPFGVTFSLSPLVQLSCDRSVVLQRFLGKGILLFRIRRK